MHERSARLRFAAVTLGVVVAGFGLTSCSALFPTTSPPPPVDSTTGEIIEENSTDVFAVEVGDCFNEVSDQQVSEIPIVECSKEHDYEVFDEFTLNQSSYPGDSAMETLANDRCSELFPAFVGISYDASILEVVTLTPTKESWANGDRIVSCIIGDPGAKTTGSLAGAGI